MSVNENIWVNSIDDVNFRNLAKTTTLTPRQLQINGTWGSFPYESTWDNSICFCGMDKASGSYLANAGVIVQTHDSILPLYKDNDTHNWNFGSTNQDFARADGKFDNNDNWSRFARWQTATSTGINQTNYQGYNIKAVHSLQLKKLLLVPVIFATSVDSADTSSSQDWYGNLHDYLSSNNVQNTYHYIRRVAFVLYYNNGTDDNPNWQSLTTSYTTRYYMQMCPHYFSDELLAVATPSSTQTNMTTSMTIHGGIFLNNRDWQPLMGVFNTSVSESTFKYRPILYDTDLSHYKTTGTLGTNISRIWYCRNWTTDKNDILADIRKQLAFYGMFFVGDTGFTSSSKLYDSCIYCGTIEDGITYGNYTHGIDNRLQPQWEWTDSNDSDYDPTGGGGGGNVPDPDPNPIGPNTPGFTLAVNNGSVCYTITQSDWQLLWGDIYGGATDWKSLIDGLSLYGSNPLNAILNYRWYPFTLGGTSTDYVRLGSTEIRPHQFHYIQNAGEAFTSSTASFWWGREKNFVNIRKSKARIWLPFYGFYELPLTQLIDRELTIQFQYNLPDDSGVWIIMFGGSIYDYVECQPYIEIPITGDNSLQIAAAKAQRNLSIAMTIGAAVGGIAVGAAIAGPAIGNIGAAVVESGWAFGGSNVAAGLANIGPLASEGLLAGLGGGIAGISGAAIGGGMKTANTVMQSALQIGNLSTNIPIHSTASDTTFLHLPFYPYVEIFTNKVIGDYKEAEYKLKVGISCDKWVDISEMPEQTLLKATGLANTNISGMELDEINELNSILQSGFYK